MWALECFHLFWPATGTSLLKMILTWSWLANLQDSVPNENVGEKKDQMLLKSLTYKKFSFLHQFSLALWPWYLLFQAWFPHGHSSSICGVLMIEYRPSQTRGTLALYMVWSHMFVHHPLATMFLLQPSTG